MEDGRWPKKIYQWRPHGGRRRGRPQQSWKNQVTDFTRSRNMEEDMEEDTHLLGCIDPNNNNKYYKYNNQIRIALTNE